MAIVNYRRHYMETTDQALGLFTWSAMVVDYFPVEGRNVVPSVLGGIYDQHEDEVDRLMRSMEPCDLPGDEWLGEVGELEAPSLRLAAELLRSPGTWYALPAVREVRCSSCGTGGDIHLGLALYDGSRLEAGGRTLPHCPTCMSRHTRLVDFGRVADLTPEIITELYRQRMTGVCPEIAVSVLFGEDLLDFLVPARRAWDAGGGSDPN